MLQLSWGKFQGRDLPYRLTVNPVDMEKFFPRGCRIHEECRENPEIGIACEEAGNNKLTKKFRHILYCFKGLKSGPYRKSALERCGATEEDLNVLCSSGYLVRKGNGIQITTSGRNEASESRDY